jgi:glycine/D-amino acid oxidase-like deaminating enzyme
VPTLDGSPACSNESAELDLRFTLPPYGSNERRMLASPSHKDFDYAVIGGGLVGMAIAWGLVRRGRRIAVLDEGDVAYRASRGNFALVWVQSKGGGLSEYALWTRRSSDLWSGFAETLNAETGLDVCFSRPGGLHLLLSERELENRASAIRQLHNQPGMQPFEYAILDHAQTRRMLPEIGPEVAGSSFCPLDGHVNSLRLLRALHEGYRRRGGSYLPNRRVERIEPREGGFRLVTATAEMGAAKVVIAAGLGTAALAPMVGIAAPVRPQRGQIIVTEKVAPFMDHVVHTIRQTDEGGVMISDSVEEAGFDDSPGSEVLAVMAGRAVRMLPLLGRLNVVRCWAALRVMPKDGYPIYDQSERCPGAFVAACHSGVTLAAGHALVLPALLDEGRLPGSELGAFGGRRFHVPAAH